MGNETRPTKMKRGDRLTLEIERLSVGGRGVARHEGLVVFVSDVAPGEQVEAELTFTKKNFAEARLIKVLRASKDRVVPPCPVAGICGGCNWQHIAYPVQLEQKRELVRESLKKFSGFDVSAFDRVEAVVPSPRPLRYRNRVQFHFSGQLFGYYQRGSHKLVDIHDCPITEEAIASRIPGFRQRFKSEKPGRAEAMITQDGEVQIRRTDEAGDEEQGGLSFSQVNSAQNEQLVTAVVSLFADEFVRDGSSKGAQSKFLDLYCGNGNFTFPLARALPESAWVGVEYNSQSVASARAKKESSWPDRSINFYSSTVEEFISGQGLTDFSAILLDPPRTGASPEVMNAIAAAKPCFIAYVSCHPVTLARDLKFLRDAGYSLDLVRPYDMFPQTDHVETLAVLRRSTSSD